MMEREPGEEGLQGKIAQVLKEGYVLLKQGFPEEAAAKAREARSYMQPEETSPADDLAGLAERVLSLYQRGAKALDESKFAFIRKNLPLARKQ